MVVLGNAGRVGARLVLGGLHMKSKLLGLIAVAIVFGPWAAIASPITYDVPGVTIDGVIMTGGTITTDGNTGTLASSDITAWSFTTSNDSAQQVVISGLAPDEAFTAANSALSATSTQLLFNFSESHRYRTIVSRKSHSCSGLV